MGFSSLEACHMSYYFDCHIVYLLVVNKFFFLSLSLSLYTSTLVIPSTRRTKLGDQAFTVTAARAWNALLPSSVRSAPSSLLQFRRDLKTALHVSVIVLFTKVSSCVTDCNF